MFPATVTDFLRNVLAYDCHLEPAEHITLYEACRGILDHLKTLDDADQAAVDEMSLTCNKYGVILSTLSTLPSIGDDGPLYCWKKYVSPFA
jgi:hypothetical protein